MPGPSKPSNRTGREASGADGEDEVAGLQRSVEDRQALAVLRVGYEVVAHLGAERQQLRDLVAKVGVDGQHRYGGC